MAVQDVAEAWDVQPGTVRAYAARGQMPTPDGRVGRSPWWHRTTITGWPRPGTGARRADVPAPEPALHGLPVVVWLHGTGGISDYGWATVATAITRGGAVVIRDRTSFWHLVRGGCTGWEVSLTARDRRMTPVRARHGDIEDGDGMDLVATGSPVSLDVPGRRDPQVLDQMGRPGGVVVDWPEVATRVQTRLVTARAR